MKFRDILWWTLAITVTIAAGIFSFKTLHTLRQPATEQLNLQPVVVAAVNIPVRRTIDLLELTTRMLPMDAIPEGAVTSLEEVIGQMATVEVYPNEPILRHQLTTPDLVTRQIALSVPDGKIVTSVPTTSQLVRNRLVRPGDRVDILATFDVDVQRDLGNKPLATSVVLLQDLEVHAIVLPVNIAAASAVITSTRSTGGIFQTSDQTAQSVLLALSPQDAVAIRHVQDVQGKLDITLHTDGAQSSTVVPVDQYYLAERYGIKMAQGQVALVGFVGSPIYPPDVEWAAYPADTPPIQ
ncbi:MAG: Flp pilus assembly protein CpaB [Caldilineaceae bacterium]